MMFFANIRTAVGHGRRCALMIAALLALLCGARAAAQTLPDGVVNFGSERQVWLQKWRALARGGGHKFRILQLGDSHTAGDYFSDWLRRRLQAEFGDGGVGWSFPHKVKGQRSAVLDFSGSWQVLSSRRDTADFPMGGVIARSQGMQILEIIPRQAQPASAITFTLSSSQQQSGLMVRDALGQQFRIVEGDSMAGQWFYAYFKATPPLSVQSGDGAVWTLGGINIENERAGVVYSAMGINGAQLGEVDKWRADWWQDLRRSRADLVVLAYGTNEAFMTPFNPEQMQRRWMQTIDGIRRTLPEAGILIIGAPESLKGTGGRCGTRAPSLDAVQSVQLQSAQQRQTLYWSWQNAMGGECGMKGWIARKLGRSDGVHFSQDGYEAAAEQLARGLIALARAQ